MIQTTVQTILIVLVLVAISLKIIEIVKDLVEMKNSKLRGYELFDGCGVKTNKNGKDVFLLKNKGTGNWEEVSMEEFLEYLQ